MAASSRYLKHLAEVPLFSTCSTRDLQKIAKAADELQVDEEREIVTQGATGHEAFIIVDGTVAVKRNGRRVATLGPGDCFGELALLDGGPRTASVITESPVTLLVLGQREFAALIDEVPGLAHKIMVALARRIRELDSKIYP
ncbi:MAG: cyclic nucleotide-binding domain-containing protein [Acidimicrobiales bacterium]|nr:cyclic nucleotide-binding domain-containing protein [Acidimicrobiales bacterium]